MRSNFSSVSTFLCVIALHYGSFMHSCRFLSSLKSFAPPALLGIAWYASQHSLISRISPLPPLHGRGRWSWRAFVVAFSLGVRQLGLWSWLLSKSGKPLASLFQLTPQGRGVWFFLFHVLGVFQEPIGTSCVQNASTCDLACSHGTLFWTHSTVSLLPIPSKHIGIAVARPGQVASLRLFQHFTLE